MNVLRINELRIQGLKETLKRLKKVGIRVLICVGLFICFVIINRLTNEHRGYKAVGGEGFIFLMPFLIVKFRDLVCDLISYIKK